jgi:hypothetical protein
LKKGIFVMKLSVVLFSAVLSNLGQGQTISHGPNRLGLEIQDVSISQDSKLRVLLKNASELPITAYVIHVTSTYSDGQQLSHETTLDFFDSLGLERLDAANHPKGAIMPNATRTSVASYRTDATPNATVTGLSVAISSVVFKDDVMLMDESVPGQAERIKDLFQVWDAKSAEIMRWCSSMDQISKAQLTREAFEEILASHSSGPSGTAEETRRALTAALQQGVEWSPSGKGSLKPAVSEAIRAQCNTAKNYLSRRDPNGNP